MDPRIQEKIQEWTSPPFDDATMGEIKRLLDKKDEKELEDRFYRTLEFGTGGLRGLIGAGTNRMNVYTVGMATQGLANYIASSKSGTKGVVIARDSRNCSDIFARESASIFAANGILVYFFEDITPTPFASYAVRHLSAISGVVITASHNPPEYNGYKVYWEDGGQITPPHDRLIIEEVNRIDSIEKIKKTDFGKAMSSGLIKIVKDEVTKAYIKDLEAKALRPVKKSDIRIAYSPLHGTGYKIIPRILEHFGFAEVVSQKEQSVPDGRFPTVKFPNPEEKEAMRLVTELGHQIDADIVMASDPDADRMGIGFKDGTGGYALINGNQIGTMLEYYLLSRSKETGSLKKNSAVIKTIVTTDLQARIAQDFGCKIYDVLTGFKWIALMMKEFDRSGSSSFVFGGEESYGYLPVDFVRDKDAVSSCYFFAEMADWLKGKNMTPGDFLDEIYLKYGLYLEDLHSLTLKGIEGSQKIGEIMENFRKSPPSELGGARIVTASDIKNLITKDLVAGTEKKIETLPRSDVLQFTLEDGSKITMRPSGTEPKIKFYFSVREAADASSLPEQKARIRKKLGALRDDLLKKIQEV